MRAIARNIFAAALILGAPFFAWPAQALLCPTPPYWRDMVPLRQVPKAASDYAKLRMAEMQSVFIGHVVFAEYVPFQDRGGAYVITYEVSEWVKGSGRPYAKVLWYPGIPCVYKGCIEEAVRTLQSDKADAVFFTDSLSSNIQLVGFKQEDLDGVDLPCAKPHSFPVAIEKLPAPSNREYDEILFRNALRLEMQAFRKNKRRP